MPRFERVVSSDYDPARGRIESIEIMVMDITPAEMQGLCDTVKRWCMMPTVGDAALNQAADVTEKTEFPAEKAVRVKEEEGFFKKRTSMHKKLMGKIMDYVTEHGPAQKSIVRAAVIPDASTKSKEYVAFFAAWQYLHNREDIVRIDPNDMESDWIVKEAGKHG